mgnify:CR=1 FL=1
MVKKETKYYARGFEIPKEFYASYKPPKIEAYVDCAEDMPSEEEFKHDFVETTS